jgi:eukaryotic-like serine/threonine-protein kinase
MNWDQAQSLFFAAADLPPSERAIFLDDACVDDAELRAEVESLIAADHGSAEVIAGAVGSEAARVLDSQRGVLQSDHDRLGPWRILRQIGRGGMGAVFLATRDDDEYRKQVAIKVVKRGMDTAEVLERFRHERQILASLDHPFIAHLYDGGTTGEGLPYFVMEFVEGQPVDVFCQERELDTKARLHLFLKICETVAYAHRNLVIHRDLKPANIFVTPEGAPKLLDFGIARVITADGGDTITGFRAFTPDYASPEQMRGERVSTATDVYSLGALLRKLLGPAPDRDLANVILMAMREEPEQRYPSADHFAADIERWLHGQPVVAGPGSILHRGLKFVRRNRWQVGAVLLTAASLIAATTISTFEYQRAERRLTDLTDLANRTLFDVNTAVQSLPGALAARQLIVRTTLDYLQRLERDGGGNERIKLALSAAYYKVALIQGSTYSPSLQDFAGAQASILKAEGLLRPIYQGRPTDPDLMLRWIQIEDSHADVVYRIGQSRASARLYEAVLPVAHHLGQLRPTDVTAAKQEALQHLWLVEVLHLDDPAGTLQHSEPGMALMRALILRFPRDKPLREDYAAGISGVASAFANADQLERAAEAFQQAIDMREKMLLDDPHNVTLQRNLIVANGNYAVVLGIPWAANLGRSADARAAASRAVTLARAMVAADPHDANARYDLAMSLSRLGSVDPAPGETARSLANLEEAIALMEAAWKANPKSLQILNQLATARQFAGVRLQSLGRIDQAEQHYLASLAATTVPWEREGLKGRATVQAMMDHELLAVLYASGADRVRAFDNAHIAVDIAQRYAAAKPSEHATAHVARAWSVLASVHSTFGETGDAREAARKAIELWRPIHNANILAWHSAAIEGAAKLAVE